MVKSSPSPEGGGGLISSTGQRIGGVLLLAMSAGFIYWTWHTLLTEGYYYRAAAALFPAFAVMSLGMIFFPIDREKLFAEYGVTKPQSFSQYPPVWKVLTVVGIAVGIGHWVLVANPHLILPGR